MKITIFDSESLITPSEIEQVPRQMASEDWVAARLDSPFEWTFVRDPKTFWFSASIPGGSDYDATLEKGEFVEGLWMRDVVEFFIKDSTGQYQEFNVSPAGAWWSVLLTSYRNRSETCIPLHPPYVEVGRSTDHWTVTCGFSLNTIAVVFDREAQIHVSGIAHKPRQRFFSSHAVRDIEPDFHHPSVFLPYQIEKLSLEEMAK